MSDDADRSSSPTTRTHPRLRLSDRPDVLEDFQRLLAEREKNNGEVLFQGSWLKPREAQQRFRRQLQFSRMRIVEMVAVTLLLLVLSSFPFAFLGVLGGIAR